MKIINKPSILIVFLSLLFCLLIHNGNAIVCPSNMCDTVQCESNTTSCPDGQHLEQTICGCCSQCVNDIAENGVCADLGGLTAPSNTQCADELICCKGICLSLTECLKSIILAN